MAPPAPYPRFSRSSGEVERRERDWNGGLERADAFPASGSHLEGYAQRLAAVAINIPFNRPHRVGT